MSKVLRYHEWDGGGACSKGGRGVVPAVKEGGSGACSKGGRGVVPAVKEGGGWCLQ